jgi:hypothetical protein
VNQNTRTVSTVGDNRGIQQQPALAKKTGQAGAHAFVEYPGKLQQQHRFGLSVFHVIRNFTAPGLPIQDSLIDQYKNYLTQNILLDSRLVFTEPLGKSSFLGIDYGVGINNTHSDRNSYNKSTGMANTTRWIPFTATTINTIFSRSGAGLSYTLIRKKFRFSAAK